MKSVWTILLFSLVAVACNQESATDSSAETTETTEVTEQQEASASVFGADFDAAPAQDLGMIDPSAIEESDSLDAVVYGTVVDVCQMKGCWMTVRSDKDTTQLINVRFKDYEFFVPKDLGGTKVAMNGKAFSEVTPVEELRHYAEDAGASEDEIALIVDPEYQLKFYASGVKIMK